MTKKKPIGHIKGHIKSKIVVINNDIPNYTIPKLFVPKVDGVPSVAKGKYWYVYYYFRHPITKKFIQGSPIKIKQGINQLKTVSERTKYGKQIISELTKLLKEGYSPYENLEFTTERQLYTLKEAIEYAYEKKLNEVKESTAQDYRHRKDNFLSWCIRNNLQAELIQDIGRNHIMAFLNYVSSKNSNRNVNNYKTALSALFGKMVDDGLIHHNFVADIKKLKTTPKRHKAYSTQELKTLKDFLLKHDPYVYTFIAVVAYTFLRPREVTRLKVGDIDLANRRIYVDTKGVGNEGLIIIDTIEPIFRKLHLDQYPDDFSLFTPKNEPGIWKTKNERDRVGYFSSRFRKLKKRLDFDVNSTIYSIRHTFAVDLYNHFLSEGMTEREAILKMLPITRHKSESSLRNYLRNVNAFVTKDFSDKFTLDF